MFPAEPRSMRFRSGPAVPRKVIRSVWGRLGSILAKISGPQKFNYTPEAIAAFPAQADANFALCVDACDRECTYPNVCAIPERKMIRDAWDARKDAPASNRYAFTSLLYPPAGAMNLSDQVCMDLPPQAVCGKQIFTIRDAGDNTLRDMESMMYNPNVDKSNKEYDKVPARWKDGGLLPLSPTALLHGRKMYSNSTR